MNVFSIISWGHVLQAVRNSCTILISYLIHVLWDKDCEVTSFSSLTWIKCIKINSKLLCTYLGGDHLTICVFGANILFEWICSLSWCWLCSLWIQYELMWVYSSNGSNIDWLSMIMSTCAILNTISHLWELVLFPNYLCTSLSG